MQSQGQLLPGPLVAPNQSQMSQQLLPQNIQTDTIASVASLNQTPPMPNVAGQNFGMQNIFDIPQNSAFAVPNQSQTSQQLLPQNIQTNTIASVASLNQTPPMPYVAGHYFGMENVFGIPQNSAFAVPNQSQTSQQLLPQNIQTNTMASVTSLNQTPPMPNVAGHYFGMENIFGIPQNSLFAVPNQSQTSQQLLPQNIQTNTMASVTSLNQTLPMPNVAGQNFGMENIFGIPQNSAFAVPNQSQTSQQLLPQNIQTNTMASVTSLNQTLPMPNVADQNFGMENIFGIPQNSAFAVPNQSQTSQQLLPQNIQTNTMASVTSLNQTLPMPNVAGQNFGMENIFGIPQNSAFAVPNQSQTSQQLLPQNIQTNTMASVTSLNQTLPMPNVAGQNFGMENIFGIPQDSVEGNSMGQEAPSNMFANSQWPGQGRPP